jgi:hypothetical protein
MSKRLFDPVAFLNESLAENATAALPLPEGEPIAQVTKLDFASGEKNGNEWNRLDIRLEISDADFLGDYPTSNGSVSRTLGIMLDMENGSIATGPNRNVRLGKFREACGVNGKPLAALVGQMVRLAIKQKPGFKDPSTTVDEIVGFSQV